MWKYEEKDELGQDDLKFCQVFKFETGRKFESSDFGRPCFFRSGKMSASSGKQELSYEYMIEKGMYHVIQFLYIFFCVY